jgi:hypothetical protein
MSEQPETRFKKKVQDRLKGVDNLWFFKVQMVALLGIPDIIGCYYGKFFAWELKKDPKSKPSRLQVWCLNQIRKAGGIGEVVHPGNFDKVFKDLTSVD